MRINRYQKEPAVKFFWNENKAEIHASDARIYGPVRWLSGESTLPYWQPEFDARDPHGGGRGLTPVCCPSRMCPLPNRDTYKILSNFNVIKLYYM